MKHQFSFFILLILSHICLVSHSQSFSTVIASTEDEYANHSIETPDGDFLVSLTRGTYLT